MPGSLTARRFVPEHMDDPEIDVGELRDALRFIRLVNARLGGTSAALGHVKRWTKDWPTTRPVRILDLGTGSADIPLALLDWGRACGRSVHVTAVDNHARTLVLAREHLEAHGERPDSPEGEPGIRLLEADARTLTARFAVGQFDIVHAGMFLHHLPDIELMTVLRIMERLGRVGLIWNDLVRDPISAVAIRVLTIASPRKVRHDAVVSVAKGFTRAETLEIARRAGLRSVEYRRHLFGRFTLTAGAEGGRGFAICEPKFHRSYTSRHDRDVRHPH